MWFSSSFALIEKCAYKNTTCIFLHFLTGQLDVLQPHWAVRWRVGGSGLHNSSFLARSPTPLAVLCCAVLCGACRMTGKVNYSLISLLYHNNTSTCCFKRHFLLAAVRTRVAQHWKNVKNCNLNCVWIIKVRNDQGILPKIYLAENESHLWWSSAWFGHTLLP